MRADFVGLVLLIGAITYIFWQAPADTDVGGLLDPTEPALGLLPTTALAKGHVALGTFLLETDEHLYVASYAYANGFAAAQGLRADLDLLNNLTRAPPTANLSMLPVDAPDEPPLLCERVDCGVPRFSSGDAYALAELGGALTSLLRDMRYSTATDIAGEVTQTSDALVIARFVRLEGASIKERVDTAARDNITRLRNDVAQVCEDRTSDAEACALVYEHVSVSATYDTSVFRYVAAKRDENVNILGPLAWRAEKVAALAGPAVEKAQLGVRLDLPAFTTLYLPLHVLLVAALLWTPALAWNAVARRLNLFPSWPMHLYGTLVLVLVLTAVLFGRTFLDSVWFTLLVPFGVLYLLALVSYTYTVPEHLHGDGFLAGAGAGILAIVVLGRGLFELQNEDLLPGLVTGVLFHDALAIILFALELAFVLALAGSIRAQYLRVRGWIDARNVLDKYRDDATSAAIQRYHEAGEFRTAREWYATWRVPSRIAVAFLPRVVGARDELTNVGLSYAKRRRLVLERRIRIRRYAGNTRSPVRFAIGVWLEWREWVIGRGAGLASQTSASAAARKLRVPPGARIDLPFGDPAYGDLVAHYATTHDTALQRPFAKGT